MILESSDKWNENLRIYANYVTADGKLARNMNEDLAADKWGIGIFAAPTVNLQGHDAVSALKILPVARTGAGPYVPYTLETLQDRTYPMYDEIYAYVDAEPPDPKVIEFLRFIVSREGQELVMKDAKYLPLTAEASRRNWTSSRLSCHRRRGRLHLTDDICCANSGNSSDSRVRLASVRGSACGAGVPIG